MLILTLKSYSHLKIKLETLEKIVQEMSTKISNLEDQLKENTTLVLPVIESNMTKDDSEVEEIAEVF